MDSRTQQRSVPFGRPLVGEAERCLVMEVLDGTVLTHGPRCAEFEKRFADFVGAAHGIAVSSCTTGLQLSLMAIGIERGDEVIVPAETHVATAHAVEHAGGRPVFVDVEAETGNIDADAVAAAVTSRTRAIMPVHYLGLPCDMARLKQIAARHDLTLVEDCALAVGAAYEGRHPGTLGTTGVFSFYPAKHMTTLEGGMVTTNDDALAVRLRKLRAFGYDKAMGERAIPGIYDVDALGHNVRMSEVHAAVGLGQLGRLADFLALRRRNTQILLEDLADVAGVRTHPIEHGPARSACYCVNVLLDPAGPIGRDEAIVALNARGVGTSVHYPVPVPLSRYYREKYGYAPGEFPVAEGLSGQAISLPVGPHVSADDASFIAECIAAVVVGNQSRKDTNA